MTASVVAVVFAAMFAGHHVGDHVAQTDAQAAGKAASKRWLGPMLGHLASYHACLLAGLLAVHLWVAALPFWPTVAALAWSALSHGFLDRRWPVAWLLRRTGSAEFADRTTPICGPYLADQSLHVAALFVAALIVGAGVS